MNVIKITVEMTEDEYNEFKEAKNGELNFSIEYFLEKKGYQQIDSFGGPITDTRFYKNEYGDCVALAKREYIGDKE